MTGASCSSAPWARLRAAVAAPLSDADARLIVEREDRIELLYAPELLPPMRFPADFAGDPVFRRTSVQQRHFEALLDSADVLYGIPDVDPMALRRVVRSNPALRWVHTVAAGGGAQVKAAELESAELDRVRFTTSAGIHGTALAEFAVFGLLAGAKQLPRLQGLQREREWPDRWPMAQLSGQTVLVLGLGGTGREVARLLAEWGTRVIGVSRHGRPVPNVDELVGIDQIVAVVERVDAVVNTLPGTETTERLLNATIFDKLPPGSTIVNVGGGAVLDTADLLAALGSNQLGFAALDVDPVEPPPRMSRLREHPRVLVSPHTAVLTAAEATCIAELFAQNATRLLDGDDLLNHVDTVGFY